MGPGRDRGRPGEEAAPQITPRPPRTGDPSLRPAADNFADLLGYLVEFRGRVMQDALTQASAIYWERRAREFDAAAPRAGDYMGRASRQEMQAQVKRCHDTAAACRARAEVTVGLLPEPISSEIAALLSGGAG